MCKSEGQLTTLYKYLSALKELAWCTATTVYQQVALASIHVCVSIRQVGRKFLRCQYFSVFFKVCTIFQCTQIAVYSRFYNYIIQHCIENSSPNYPPLMSFNFKSKSVVAENTSGQGGYKMTNACVIMQDLGGPGSFFPQIIFHNARL